MYSIPSTPLIACSSGVATVRAITSAEAPGKSVVTLMVGGTMFGYWAIGNVNMVASAGQHDEYVENNREARVFDEEMSKFHG